MRYCARAGAWLVVLTSARAALAEGHGALVLYASDRDPGKSSRVTQELENLCSTLSDLRWSEPIYMALPDPHSAILDRLASLEKGKAVPIGERKDKETELQKQFVMAVDQLRNNTAPSSALRRCSADHAKTVELAVGLEVIESEEHMFHYSAVRMASADPVRAQNIPYNPRDGSVLLREISKVAQLSGDIAIVLPKPGELTLEPAPAATRPQAAQEQQETVPLTPSKRCKNANAASSAPGLREWFCDVVPGRYELTAQLEGCREQKQSVNVSRRSTVVSLECVRAWPMVPTIFAAATVVSAAAAITTGVLSGNANEKFRAGCPSLAQCPESLRGTLEDTNDYARANHWFWAGAGVSLAGFVVTGLIWLEPAARNPSLDRAVSHDVLCSGDGCRVTAGGTF